MVASCMVRGSEKTKMIRHRNLSWNGHRSLPKYSYYNVLTAWALRAISIVDLSIKYRFVNNLLQILFLMKVSNILTQYTFVSPELFVVAYLFVAPTHLHTL